jgi:DsbC/DsbD-like thiol-disulfide interchange protein
MRLLLAALALSAAAAPLAAAQSLSQGVTGVRIIGGWQQPDGSRIAAVAIGLAPGWHTYWRMPGEAGIPPEFDWSGSRNLASVAYEWPRPTLFDSGGMRTIGYADALVLPVRLVPRDPSAPLDVRLALSFGVCDDICVPAQSTVSLRLAPDAPPGGRAEIEAALAARAESAAEAGVVDATCALVPAADGYRVDATVTFADAPDPGQYAVLESSQPDLWIGPAESETRGRTVSARAPIETRAAGPMLERRSLRLTLLDGRRAVEIEGCAAPG